MLEIITHPDISVKLDGFRQELVHEIDLARQNARITLVRMQKLAEEIISGRHPKISPDEQRVYEITIQQLRQFEVPVYRRIDYLKTLFKLSQDYSEIRRYVRQR